MDMDNIKKLQDLEDQIDELYDEQSRKLYNYIETMGEKAFEEGSPLYKFRDSDLFERLIKHFEELEEYEKCAFLVKASWNIKRSIIESLI
jgi:hypothetical protein